MLPGDDVERAVEALRARLADELADPIDVVVVEPAGAWFGLAYGCGEIDGPTLVDLRRAEELEQQRNALAETHIRAVLDELVPGSRVRTLWVTPGAALRHVARRPYDRVWVIGDRGRSRRLVRRGRIELIALPVRHGIPASP
ncbi:MAG: hypothetical protein ACKO91_01155 [Acidimicrobiales bacterium]